MNDSRKRKMIAFLASQGLGAADASFPPTLVECCFVVFVLLFRLLSCYREISIPDQYISDWRRSSGQAGHA